MVRGPLDGEIQGHLQALGPGLLHELPKILERPQLRVDGLVAPFCPADGPGAARVLGRGHRAVVTPLAVDPTDGVDGRQIHHVEPQARDIGQPRPDNP